MTEVLLDIALPVPKRRLFEYRIPADMPCPAVGTRVQVPFANRTLIGVVIKHKSQAQWPLEKLKYIERCLDSEPVVDETMLSLLQWASQYYHHPVGDVLYTALPALLRQGHSSAMPTIRYWQVVDDHPDVTQLKRAPRQLALFELLQHSPLPDSEVMQQFSRAILKPLEQKGFIGSFAHQPRTDSHWAEHLHIAAGPTPGVEQALAITAIHQHLTDFHPFLLEGVTGSGKTEVYLQAIEPVLQAGKQVLILVPEIGLTPQTVSRFRQRFNVPVGLLHSQLNDAERLVVWRQARSGELGIVIGTRSAIFTPFARLGMLIVDEEHDSSYKQQDGLRYHGRDLAVMRARQQGIPLILGSATPSLESLHNALQGRYQHFQLQQRAGLAQHTRQQLLDMKNQPLKYGLAMGMVEKIRQHLQAGNQVMVFINRRGFAPSLVCHQCGHVESCPRCERSYTLHKRLHKLQCHHCGDAKPIPSRCPQCHSASLLAVGVGTEQLEQGLSQLFADYPSVRIDSDNMRSKQRMHDTFDAINRKQYSLLIGTQILAKGHHFPQVTLVVIVDVDGALFSMDFRAAEHLAQLITQVSGRAGRAEHPGEMWLQTHQPGHPLLQDLLNNGYGHFARYALDERKAAALPPFAFMALVRAEAHHAEQAFEFLQQCAGLLAGTGSVELNGPMPALMEKRQGRYRMQLLVKSDQRKILQQALFQALPGIENLPLANRVRWSVDVDPQDFS